MRIAIAVFALMHMPGFRFAPRIRDLGDTKLYIPGTAHKYPGLKAMIGGTLNLKHLRAHWDDILRLASSIKHGTVTASLALRESGRIERTLFTIKIYPCIACGFIYDESAGMPADWSCPDCGVAKADVEMVEL